MGENFNKYFSYDADLSLDSAAMHCEDELAASDLERNFYADYSFEKIYERKLKMIEEKYTAKRNSK